MISFCSLVRKPRYFIIVNLNKFFTKKIQHSYTSVIRFFGLISTWKTMLKEIFFDNWKKIIFVYFIVLLETIFFSIQPTIIGNAIDDLINGSYLNIYIYSVFIVFLLAIGTARRFLDTRIYISIWKDSVLKSIEKMRSKNVSSEKIFSRYNLTNYYVDAFEVVIPHMIKDVVFSFMSIFMVFLISHKLSIILILMIAISVLNYIIIVLL